MEQNFIMPAEWENQTASWLAWPHEESDWPGKMGPISWVYAEIVRVLAESETVQLVCHNQQVKAEAEHCLKLHRVNLSQVNFHLIPNNRSWLRDSMPTAVRSSNSLSPKQWVKWNFRAWAKYDNYELDEKLPQQVSELTKRPLLKAERMDNNQAFCLEGGAIDVDGQGTLLTTEECLLSKIQERNPGLDRSGYEALFAKYLGISKTIWLGNGCAGDDTHGHVDDIARFVSAATVVLSYTADEKDENHPAARDNFERLSAAKDALGRNLEVIKLPMPRAIYFGEERLPASYANFYIANHKVLVPTFNDPQDYQALGILRELFPSREVVGIHSVDLVLGQGTLHCLTQQQI